MSLPFLFLPRPGLLWNSASFVSRHFFISSFLENYNTYEPSPQLSEERYKTSFFHADRLACSCWRVDCCAKLTRPLGHATFPPREGTRPRAVIPRGGRDEVLVHDAAPLSFLRPIPAPVHRGRLLRISPLRMHQSFPPVCYHCRYIIVNSILLQR